MGRSVVDGAAASQARNTGTDDANENNENTDDDDSSRGLFAYAARNAVVLMRVGGSLERADRGGHGDLRDGPPAPRSFAGILVGHTNRVTALAFARCDGVAHLLVSGGADKQVRLWDTAARGGRRCVRVLRGHAAEVSAVATSPTVPDLAVSGDRSGKVLVWSLGAEHGGLVRVLAPVDASPVLCLALSPHPASPRDLAVGHQSGALAVVDVAEGHSPTRLPARGAEVHAAAWLPPRHVTARDDPAEEDGEVGVLAVGSRERAVTLWAWRAADRRVSLAQTLPLPRCLPHLSEAQRGRLWLALAWVPARATHVPDQTGGTSEETDAVDGQSGRSAWLVSTSHGGDLLRWTVRLDDLLPSRGGGMAGRSKAVGGGTNQAPNTPTPQTFGPTGAAHTRTVFSVVARGGHVITTSLDRTVAKWDVATCRREWVTAGLGGFAYAVAVNPEEPFSVGVACGDGTVQSLDVAALDGRRGVDENEGVSEVLWRGLPQTKVMCVAWHPTDASDADGGGGGGLLAAGLEDGRVVVVNTLGGGRYAIQRDCHAGPVTSMQWINVNERGRDDAAREGGATTTRPSGDGEPGDGRVDGSGEVGGGATSVASETASEGLSAARSGDGGLDSRTETDVETETDVGSESTEEVAGAAGDMWGVDHELPMPPKWELVTLGGGRIWRWDALTMPSERKKGGGGGRKWTGRDEVDSTCGSFHDMTQRLQVGGDGGGGATSTASRDITAFDFCMGGGARIAVGWSDGVVSVHGRTSGPSVSDGAFITEWSAREHSKRITAVRWHPESAIPVRGHGNGTISGVDSGKRNGGRFRGWVGATAADGSLLVYGPGGEILRSTPPSRQAVLDLAWRPPGMDPHSTDGGAGAMVATAGADGITRVWDLATVPSLHAVMRGHDGRVLSLCWVHLPGDSSSGESTAQGPADDQTAAKMSVALLTGSDDQTVRWWDVYHPRHAPAAAAAAAAAAKEAPAPSLPAALRRQPQTDAGPSSVDATTGEQASAVAGVNDSAPRELSDKKDEAAPGQTDGKPGGGAVKKKRKGTGGRGLLKPPAWESTPEGIAAGQSSAVGLARRLYGGGDILSPGRNPAPPSASESGYGPSGVGLFVGQEDAKRLLCLEERTATGERGEGRLDSGSSGGGESGGGWYGAGALHGAERAAAAAIFRGDFAAASTAMLASTDGPIPADFLAALIGGGRDLWSTVALAQADRLESKGEHQRAALLRLALHDVRGAVGALRRGGLPRDAAALAAARLLPADPLLAETWRELAVAEEHRGGMEAAAKAHLAAGRPAAAVRALVRRGPMGALAAAEVALTCCARGAPEKHVVMRAAVELGEAGRFDEARAMLERWGRRGVASSQSEHDEHGREDGGGWIGAEAENDAHPTELDGDAVWTVLSAEKALHACGIVVDAAALAVAAAAAAASPVGPQQPTPAADGSLAAAYAATSAPRQRAILLEVAGFIPASLLSSPTVPQSPRKGDWGGVSAMRGGRCTTRTEVARLFVEGATRVLSDIANIEGSDPFNSENGAVGGAGTDAALVPREWLAAGVLLARRGEWDALDAFDAREGRRFATLATMMALG